ncbi:MAG: murein biosynthesis integral membrane protein MurJ [Myxococcaceae bacterium]
MSGAKGALLVATGILASRLAGLIREAVFAQYFGNTPVAAAFKAALRVPNFLQNLLGEGVLSASFIPVYSQALGAKDTEAADKVAGAIFGLLSLVTAIVVALGIVVTPGFIDLVAPGFEGETRTLAISLVRILFPMTGLMVLSAWCLGILNSHRRFLLSYAAPVIWNGAMIAVMVAVGGRVVPERLAVYLAWGAVAGALLQFAIQLPSVIRLLGAFRPSLSVKSPPVRQVLRSFGPVLIGRGVVQISSYVDLILASLISAVAVSTLDYAQRVYLIPVSLFGMAISAAELPEMSRATGELSDASAKLRERVEKGLARVAFFVVPSVAAFVALGDVIASALLERGQFTAADSRLIWYVLIGSGIGLLAATQSRLFSSTFYALKDTRTPLNFAVIRVAVGAGLAYLLGVVLPRALGIPHIIGTAGVAGAAGIAAWIEFLLLRRKLGKTIGPVPLGASRLLKLWAAAIAAALLGVSIKIALTHTFGASPAALTVWGGSFLPQPALMPVATAVLVLGAFGVTYLGLTWAFGIPEASAVLRRVLRRESR